MKKIDLEELKRRMVYFAILLLFIGSLIIMWLKNPMYLIGGLLTVVFYFLPYVCDCLNCNIWDTQLVLNPMQNKLL